MYSGKIAVPPGGGGIRKISFKVESLIVLRRVADLDFVSLFNLWG
jgi:hypothetical protein